MKLIKLIAGLLGALIVVTSASAAVVYENGSLSGLYAAIEISPSQQVSNSFKITTPAHLTLATVGLWALESEPVALTWMIGRNAFGSDIGSGASTLSNSFVFTNQFGYNVYSSSFALDVTLGAGDYWFSLTNGSDRAGMPIYWDINLGPSLAQYRGDAGEDRTESEFFRLSGDATTDPDPGPGTNPVPEPASLVLLVAGMMGLAASLRRRQRTAA